MNSSYSTVLTAYLLSITTHSVSQVDRLWTLLPADAIYTTS